MSCHWLDYTVNLRINVSLITQKQTKVSGSIYSFQKDKNAVSAKAKKIFPVKIKIELF